MDDALIILDGNTLDAAGADGPRLDQIVDRIAAADVVFLGEANHFVHEKADFRLWWLRRLAARRPLIVGEELGWSDGRDVTRFLLTGDAVHLDRAATFGDRRHVRSDRDDSPTGILAASYDAYPTDLFKAEQHRFYRALRALPHLAEPGRFFGFDIDAPGAGYEDLAGARGDPRLPDVFWSHLEPVEAESLADEADRLETASRLVPEGCPAVRADLDALIGSLRYAALALPASGYEALRPAMALREEVMKRHVERVLSERATEDLVVLMGHAFHLVKDDTSLRALGGVGPGGGLVPSVGDHVARGGSRVRSVWMLYGEGEDSQPFPDLPRRATYPADTLNARLAVHRAPAVLPIAGRADDRVRDWARVGHMYNAVAEVDLSAAVDAVWFDPRVTPMRAGTDAAAAGQQAGAAGSRGADSLRPPSLT